MTKLITKFEGIADDDYLIAQTAMTIATNYQTRPVVVVTTDTDLLAMLTAQSKDGMDLHMLFGRTQSTAFMKFSNPSVL